MNALLVNYYRYPDGDAGSLRQEAFAKLLEQLGYNVTVIGMGKHTNYEIRSFNNVKYTSLRGPQNSAIGKLNNYIFYKKHLSQFLKNIDPPALILVNDIPLNALWFIKKYALGHHIRLLYDSVEWYSPEQFTCGRISAQYILKNRYNRKWIDNNFSVIAISKYLESHFKSRRIDTVRIPVILDTKAISCKKLTSTNRHIFIYAGAPGKKDYLKIIMAGFAFVAQTGHRFFEFRIIGVNRQQMLTECGVNEQDVKALGESLIVMGRISRDDVLKNLEEADFTILLRSEIQRYAKAGFPTKVVESLASATPVITNLTSDLGDYLSDGYNSIIINGCTKEAVTEALGKAISMAPEAKVRMQKNARETALRNFDYKSYIQVMKRLLNGDKIDDTK